MLDSFRLSRRGLLKRLLIGAAASAVPVPGILPVRPARAEVLLALQTIGTILSLVSGFARGDGGLGAMLRSQNELLHVALEQLSKIQLQLAEINAKLDRLLPGVEQLLEAQYRKQLTLEIVGAAKNYTEVMQAGLRDPHVFEQRKEALAEFGRVVAKNRAQLSATAEGQGPYAAVIAPIACALEVSVMGRLGTSRELIIEVLRSYQTWLLSILGSGAGAIETHISAAISAHDAIIRKAAERPHPRSIGIDAFLMGGSQQGSGNPDACLVTSPTAQPGWTRDASTDAISPTQYAELLIAASFMLGGAPVAVAYRMHADLRVEEDQALGVLLIRYDDYDKLRKDVTYYSPSGNVRGFDVEGFDVTLGNVPCGAMGHPAGRTPVSMLSDIARNAAGFSPVWNAHVTLANEIMQANAERAKIGYAMNARLIAQATLTRVRDQLAFMGA
jgi:hypothetical protein